MFDDKKLGVIFPTRSGTPTGTANERQMLDKTGAGDISKSYRTLADGSVVRCETRNGMPRFIVEKTAGTTSAELAAYMESGVLEFSYPGDENPTRLDPAVWHMLGENPQSRWMGEVKTANAMGDQSAKQAGTLFDGIDSQAIGYPRGEATKKDDYGSATMGKKIVVGWFPPSLFSGKMRLFMQAQYGARETKDGFRFHIDVLGESALLYYDTVQFGLWSHNSPGIFTAPDKTFWLIVIRVVSGSTYTAVAYPLKQDANGKVLFKQYAAGNYDAAEKDELEAYIFAHSTINTESPTYIGTWDAGVEGSAIAYGWKWKSDGSEASVVIHDTVEATAVGGTAGKYVYRSHTLKLAFSYSNGAFSLSGTSTTHGFWCDGWGAYNIFVPEQESLSAPLMAYSLFWGGYRDFDYSSVPIYGYYKDDEWAPITLSRVAAESGPWPKNRETWGGNARTIYMAHDALNGVLKTTSATNADSLMCTEGTGVYSVEIISARSSMTVSFDGAVYEGSMERSSRWELTSEASVSAGDHRYSDVVFSAFAKCASPVPADGSNRDNYPDYMPPSPCPGAVEAMSFTVPAYGYTNYLTHYYNWTLTSREYPLNDSYRVWALAIPAMDAESAYISTHSYITNVYGVATETVTTRSHAGAIMNLIGSNDWGGDDAGKTLALGPQWFFMRTGPSFYGDDAATITQQSPEPPETPSTTEVYCFNTEIQGVQGTPGGSYYTLFNVDHTHPYYERGMSMLTSFGGKYKGSEGVEDPASLPDGRFVGWV